MFVLLRCAQQTPGHPFIYLCGRVGLAHSSCCPVSFVVLLSQPFPRIHFRFVGGSSTPRLYRGLQESERRGRQTRGFSLIVLEGASEDFLGRPPLDSSDVRAAWLYFHALNS